MVWWNSGRGCNTMPQTFKPVAVAQRMTCGICTATSTGISALGLDVLSDRIVIRHRIFVGGGRFVRNRIIPRNWFGWNLMVIGYRHGVLRVA